ncbi:MAG TPA: PA14 domain-containing protein [Pyrinomonadaceae bacterium]|nr:PA14 domain-containing protein [Pyrinomonadaceae bacterium]
MKNNVMRIAGRLGLAILITTSAYPTGGAQTDCQGQFRVQYFKNKELKGEPHFTSCERSIDNDWGRFGPTKIINSGKSDAPGERKSVGNDRFSVRWEGRFQFQARSYTFEARADDGLRVWVDDQLIIDEWRVQGVSRFTAQQNMTAGFHKIKVEYYEEDGGAVASLKWR